MRYKEIAFITSNKLKYTVAKKYFKYTKIKLLRKSLECPEIQDMNVSNVAASSAKFMAEKLKSPVIKSDIGFYIEALDGFPGTYMHDVEKSIKEHGFERIMRGERNRNVKYVEALAYCEPGKRPVVFLGEIKGTLSLKIRGRNGFGIDYLFIPENSNTTVASMHPSEMKNIYDFKVWSKLLKYIGKKYTSIN